MRIAAPAEQACGVNFAINAPRNPNRHVMFPHMTNMMFLAEA
jgi:hypothetical protein